MLFYVVLSFWLKLVASKEYFSDLVGGNSVKLSSHHVKGYGKQYHGRFYSICFVVFCCQFLETLETFEVAVKKDKLSFIRW